MISLSLNISRYYVTRTGAYGQEVDSFSVGMDLNVSTFSYNCSNSEDSFGDCQTNSTCQSQQTALATCQGKYTDYTFPVHIHKPLLPTCSDL